LTYRQSPGTPEAALHWVLQNYAQRLVETWTGLQYDSLRRMANPHHRAELPFKLAVKIDQGLASIGHATVFGPLFNDLFNEGSVTVSGSRDASLEQPLMAAALEFQVAAGELAGLALGAIRNGENVNSVEQQAELVAKAARGIAAVFRGNVYRLRKPLA
jgi:hypothetical protein